MQRFLTTARNESSPAVFASDEVFLVAYVDTNSSSFFFLIWPPLLQNHTLWQPTGT